MEPTEKEFQLFKLLNGGTLRSDPLFVGRIPISVSEKLGWRTNSVFLSYKDAQKIRHHPMHGMGADKGMALPMVIKFGDYYQSRKRGTRLQIEVVLHEPNPKRAYFLVLSRDRSDTGIFLRTFYFTAELPRSKMKTAETLHKQSDIEYFKR